MFRNSTENRHHMREPSLEAKAIAHEQHRLQWKQRAIGALALGLFLGVHVDAYASDVISNQEIQSEANVNVSVVAPPLHPENSYKGLVFFDGFGNFDSLNLAKYRIPIVQQVLDGTAISTNYNNASLDIPTIAKGVAHTASENGITELTLVGYSAGGNILLSVEDYLEKYTTLTITANIFESTPDGVDGLQPDKQSEVGIVKTLKHISGAEYSTPVRFLGEMAFRSGNYTAPLSGSTVVDNGEILWRNVTNFFSTAQDVEHFIGGPKTPGTWLMFDQELAIEKGNFKDHIQDLDALPATKQRPVFIYINNPDDGIVNNPKSADNMAVDTNTAHVPYLSFSVQGAIHGRPDLGLDSLKQAYAEHAPAIHENIERQAIVANMNQVFAKAALKAQKDVAQFNEAQKKQQDTADTTNQDAASHATSTAEASPAP